jgi:hypothetical protein
MSVITITKHSLQFTAYLPFYLSEEMISKDLGLSLPCILEVFFLVDHPMKN